MSEKDFSVRRFMMSDASNVIELLKIAFNRDFSQEWWNWKYKLNPAGFYGEEGDIWIAEVRDEIAGY